LTTHLFAGVLAHYVRCGASKNLHQKRSLATFGGSLARASMDRLPVGSFSDAPPSRLVDATTDIGRQDRSDVAADRMSSLLP